MRARFILAGAIVALVAAALSFLLLLPSYFVLAAKSPASSAVSITTGQEASDTAAIITTKALLSELAPIAAASTTATDAIAAALSLRPTGVSVDQITYVSGSPSSLMLVGTAATTLGISAYRDALVADPLFSSVSVPVGALVGTEGGRFSITLSGIF